ncbi:PAS domain-containing sensor histidine kinase [Hydrotalea sandarakina]|jgi:PAS domain S-box-containing protein|uniref:histidine kinase n=1 Tax=Hydrotalea sandarakina TaxID=1004304 RepID=A0A2W7S8P1_9BACT|nr:PAS domain-containing sensor histidine kinase [Hydrotalea sandarakina]PZX63527.1 PAS domain S-box-containing protein [Hydrotalea sandarakina]
MPNKEGFSALFTYATEGIIVVNERGYLTMANPAAEKLFGYESGELLNIQLENLIPKRFTKSHQQYRNQYAHQPYARSMGIGMNLFALRKDGTEFPVEVSLSPFKTAEGNFVIAFIIDITIRKQTESALLKQKEELEKLNSELEKRVRHRTLILEEALHELERSREELSQLLEKEKEVNELKSRFVSMASHEFRTPLATILSSLNLVEKYGELNDRENQQRHILRIKSAINHMTDILNDMLSISKIEEGKIVVQKDWVNVVQLSQNIIQEIQPILKAGQVIHFHPAGQELAYIDPNIFITIVTNLLSNAIKFSPVNKPIYLNLNITDEQLTIVVKDEGMGIPEEDQSNLFNRFFRAKNVTNIQGTGLGLNIIARYVELLNGNITFESRLEQGTTFTIVIPNIIENA